MVSVYIVEKEDACKIGISSGIRGRLSTLQTANTEKLILAGSVQCESREEALKLEAELHSTFEEHRVLGEWFAVSSTIIINELVSNNHQVVYEVTSNTSMVGNGKHGSMDIIDIFQQLNNGEMELMKFFRDEMESNKALGEQNPNRVVPTRSDDFSKYLKTALKKNFPHMECLKILKRVQRGTYMLNPSLFIPAKGIDDIRAIWDEIGSKEC